MGTNCLPPAAQLYLAVKWEGRLQKSMQEAFPSVYKRFLDDGFCLFEGSESELMLFINALNAILPNIRITFSYSRSSVDCLDLVIYKAHSQGRCCLKVRTHQKVLNKYLYIPFNSFHNPGVFKSFIHAELIRYVVTNSDECWFDCMVQKFRHRLLRRGYPARLIDAALLDVSFSQRKTYLQSTKTTQDNSKGNAFIVPYAPGVPEMGLQQVLHDVYMSCPGVHGLVKKPFVCFTKGKSLGSVLVKAGA